MKSSDFASESASKSQAVDSNSKLRLCKQNITLKLSVKKPKVSNLTQKQTAQQIGSSEYKN